MRHMSFRALWVVFIAACAVGCKTAGTNKKRPPSAPGPAPAAAGPKELVQLGEWEDRRSLGDASQVTQWALTHADPLVRGRAFLALARIQDPATADTVGQGLSDSAPLPRFEAAFAAGILGLSWAPLAEGVKGKLVERLREVEAAEADLDVRLAQLEALGRFGTPAAVDRLVERLVGSSPPVQARAALSLGVAAKRDAQLPARALASLSALLRKENVPEVRYGAAYALALSKAPAARGLLLVGTQDELSQVRAICSRGLGDVGTEADAVTLRKLLDDSDYRVAVEATRSLAKLAARCRSGSCAPLGALVDLSFRVERLARGDVAGGAQPLLTLAQQGLPAAGRPVLVRLRQQVVESVRSVTDPRLKADMANLDCRLAAALDRQTGALVEVLNCGGGLVSEARRIALGLREVAQARPPDAAKRVAEVGAYVHHTDASVKVAALQLLGEWAVPSALDKVRPLLGSTDPVVASAAAAVVAKLKDKDSIPALRQLATRALTLPDIAPVVADALAELGAKEAEAELRPWLGSTHANVRLAGAQALARLTGQPVSAPRVERPVDQVKPPYLPKDAAIKVKTEKGDFEVRLYTGEAPLTSLNLYTLAKKGFFKGLTFHRVVPDFVVQGGDPRGDGEGGPGYTIRCEVNHKPYARGVVGMALSGKDTGGSQFFVTASPQPHLDGRYTAVGEITHGLEIVDSLLEGDRILEVRATP